MFSPAPRAKFDAWSSYSAKYLAETNGLDQARERYVEIARGVGWAGEGLNEGDDEDIDLDGIEDEQIVTRKDKGKEKAQGGMGASVSVMSTGDDESERER